MKLVLCRGASETCRRALEILRQTENQSRAGIASSGKGQYQQFWLIEFEGDAPTKTLSGHHRSLLDRSKERAQNIPAS
jgi:hypothetical protein